MDEIQKHYKGGYFSNDTALRSYCFEYDFAFGFG